MTTPPSHSTTAAPVPNPRSLEPLWQAYFVRVLLSQFLFGLAFSTYFVLPKFLIEELGAGPALVGNAHGVFALATVLSVPLVSWSLRRAGAMKVLRGGLLLAVLGFAGFAAADGASVVLLLRAIQGVAFGLVFSAGSTLVVELAPASRRGEAIGYFGTAMIATNAFGPVVAEGVAAAWGWPSVFLLSGGYALLGLLNVARLRVPERVELCVPEATGALAPVASGALGWAMVATVAMGIGIGTSKSFIPAIIVDSGGQSTSAYFLSYTAGALVQRVGLGRLPDRLGHLRATISALGFYSIALAWASLVEASAIPLAAVLVGMAHGLLYPAVSAWTMGLVSPQARGQVTAWSTGAFNAGFALSASGLPAAFGDWGYRGLVLVGAVVLGMAAAAVSLGTLWSGRFRRRSA